MNTNTDALVKAGFVRVDGTDAQYSLPVQKRSDELGEMQDRFHVAAVAIFQFLKDNPDFRPMFPARTAASIRDNLRGNSSVLITGFVVSIMESYSPPTEGNDRAFFDPGLMAEFHLFDKPHFY